MRPARRVRVLDLAALIARVLLEVLAPFENRGRRECRMRAAPAVSCASLCIKMRTRVYRFSGEHPAFPAQWLYGLYRALPGEPRLCCHRRLADTSATLDASIRASGPHDFTVRISAVRYRHCHVHRISPHVRDDHDPPLVSGETDQFMVMICPTREAEYF